ncbi:uracil phosphoribosyltransferase [Iodidimonas nitroreducens]|uniref:Uracil phosphoribosyltransferase n=1 Tax=Iodidimonas nitroreducens TaxID=1236968 RepID=A0A5A7N6D9_9PROT|nr:uracil phosphoribosyltransferase [Iodidimonas nitroreducens]GAK33953.1 uracil phosphoribosyltransferase [alpha proteobacterium Q-1]GER03871.1 uracil phosphoribosyltransferase [Iodidimonas nitroreducens]
MTKATGHDLTIVDHPLIRHKLTLMRQKDTPSAQFRQLLREISLLLAYEVTRDLPLQDIEIETPLEKSVQKQLSGKKPCFVSIMRAGDGLLQGLLDLVPSARVGHVGLYRDHETLKPVQYYFKMPHSLDERHVLIVDPMLATGNSAAAAVSLVKEAGADKIRFLCLVAAPKGVETLRAAHPDVPIFSAALDDGLNEHGYITPGLGDVGDRLFGTK